MRFEPITPRDINNMKLTDILPLIEDVDPRLPKKEGRLNLTRVLYKSLGYDLSPDAALVLVDETPYQMIDAVAGSGKTSLAQAKVMLKKVIFEVVNSKPLYGKRVLCLVYNEKNVYDMKEKHRNMVTKVRRSGLPGFNIDDEINATTLHSFCQSWLKEYELQCGLSGYDLLTDTRESLDILKDGFSLVAKKQQLPLDQNYHAMKSLYDFTKERMVDATDEACKSFIHEIGLPAETLELTYKAYESLKTRRKRYDYIEMLTKFKTLMETNEKARKRIQEYYDYVVIDEVQDFTPLMHAIGRLIVGDNNSALLIGDEDQTLYDFKGADVRTMLDFPNMYQGGKVYLLSKNRRCKSNIVKAASYIVSANENRFDKEIIPAGDGGSVELIGYSTEEGQVLSIANQLEKLSPEERSDIAICYRNGISSMLLSDELEARGIRFNVNSGYGAFSHELYKIIFDVMDMLTMPYNIQLHLNLSKVLPISFPQLAEVLGWDRAAYRYKGEKHPIHFKSIDFGQFSTRKTFSQELEALAKISEMSSKVPMNRYFEVLFEMILKYHWNWRMEQNEARGREELDKVFTRRIFKFFNVEKTYAELYKEYSMRVELARRAQDAADGVTLSTFHSLKGLEFKECWMISLDDSIFPAENADLESETRICYVAMTRPKERLRMFYYTPNPSHYVRRLFHLEKEELEKREKEVEQNLSNLQPSQSFNDVSEIAVSNKSKGGVDIFGNSDFLNNLFKKI